MKECIGNRKKLEVLRQYFSKVGHKPPTCESPAELVKIQILESLTRSTELKSCRNLCEVFTRLFFGTPEFGNYKESKSLKLKINRISSPKRIDE